MCACERALRLCSIARLSRMQSCMSVVVLRIIALCAVGASKRFLDKRPQNWREGDPMVQEGQEWRVLGALAGSAALAGAAALVLKRRRQRPKPLPARLAEELEIEPAIDAVREAVREARERLARYDGRALRDVTERTRKELPKRTREALKHLEVERERLSKLVQRDVAPTTQRVAQEALQEAERVLSAARERAGAVASAVQQTLPTKARESAEAVGGAVAELADRVRAQRPQDRLPVLRRSTRSASPVERIVSGVRQVVGDLVAIGFWGGATAAIVYFGLLNAAQRARVRRALHGAWEQMQELLGDFEPDANAFTDYVHSA